MFCVCHGYEPAKFICHVFICWISCNIMLPPSTWYLCRDVSPPYRLARVSGYSQEFWHQAFQLIPCVSKIRPEQRRWPIYRAGSHNTPSHSSTIHALFVRHSLRVQSDLDGWISMLCRLSMSLCDISSVFVCACVCVWQSDGSVCGWHLCQCWCLWMYARCLMLWSGSLLTLRACVGACLRMCVCRSLYGCNLFITGNAYVFDFVQWVRWKLTQLFHSNHTVSPHYLQFHSMALLQSTLYHCFFFLCVTFFDFLFLSVRPPTLLHKFNLCVLSVSLYCLLLNTESKIWRALI